DVVLVVLIQRDRLDEVTHITVDARPHEPLATRGLEDLTVLTLAALHHRGSDQQARALRERQHLVGYLLDRLPADLAPAHRAMVMADARVEQAQIVVDLGHRADRRARVLAGALLVD